MKIVSEICNEGGSGNDNDGGEGIVREDKDEDSE